MEKMVAEVEAMGIELRLAGGKVKASIPPDMQSRIAPLLERLRENRQQLVDVLSQRDVLEMPPGVRLVEWHPKRPPVVIERYSVVNDVVLFAQHTLEELGFALAGRNWLAGNRSVRELVDRLEEVGVKVEVQKSKSQTRNCEDIGEHR